MSQLNNTISNFYLTILQREFDIFYDDLKKVENIFRVDETLLEEVNVFLEDLRSHRRELNRKQANIKNNSNEEDSLAQQIEILDTMESQVVEIIEC